MTKSERELKTYAAEKTISVKILLEEIHCKASFAGKEGTEVKRIPDLCGGEDKGTTTVMISFEVGDASSIIRRRAQRPRRDIDTHTQTSPGPHNNNSNNAHCRTHTHIDKAFSGREQCCRRKGIIHSNGD